MILRLFARYGCGLLAALGLFGLVPSGLGQIYNPPSTNRTDTLLDSGWRFIRQNVTNAETTGFDDSTWTALDLPHTWNNLDGQDGGNNYYRGIGWYRRHYTVSTNAAGQRLFLKFDGANIVTDVYVNGTFIGEHRGGFGAFTFDVTSNLTVGADNVIAVKVSNAGVPDVAPQSADFTFFGGLYRDVHLLATDPLHISPLDFGSPGVYLEVTNVSTAVANLSITTVVSNAYPSSRTARVRAVVVNAATNIVQALTNFVVLPAGGVSNVAVSTVISGPHLWDGFNDPYLYQVFVEVGDGTNTTDWVSQPLGFRWWNFDPTNGVTLNGHPYDLHGVNMHQDWLNRGWAIGDAERETNFMFIKELGVTMMRLSHYEHDDYTYQLADRNGVAVWTEVPFVNGVGSGNFSANAEQQMVELIRQRRNHPSVIAWGTFNEVSSPSADPVVSNLVRVVHREDPTRPATGASNQGINSALNWMPDIVSFNEYFGWYSGTTADLAGFLDNLHTNYPARVVGISEYGAGASLYQHSEEPLAPPPPFGTPHPEEWQNKFHEDYWLTMKQRPYLWCKLIWNMFDFAVDSRNEGDTPGRNDKGLATYDRQLHKDIFYFYKANWTTNPLVYITGHTFTNRLTNSITAKVYANCDLVELFLNGVSQGTRASTNRIFTWPITLAPGSNSVQAVGTVGSTQVSDALAWFTSSVSITNPASSIVFLNSTNDTLQLSAAAPSSGGPIQSLWTQTSGPGTITFGNSNALTTTARFNAEGVYGLTITVTNGPGGLGASAGLTVVVNPSTGITSGLQGWWKMDESGGSIAADSSGNGRNATNVSGVFTTGYISNALQFNGTTSRATFNSQNSNQVTVTAWARADGQGNSQFPRIVETPTFRVFFRFGSSDVNSAGFATLDAVNGDFDSGGGTISLGAWYHVAVRYDRSNPTNVPAFYLNGSKVSTVTLTLPSGTAPPLSGTGTIGNRAALDRAWNGLIDDLRIYNRLLTDNEIQAIATSPPANLAPSVAGGSSQTNIWPAPANLVGTVSDDGKPSPPAAVTTTWSKLSGPGTVAFGNSNALSTTATFSAPGSYVLQLAASDGKVQTVSAVAINVIARPAIQIQVLPNSVHLAWSNEIPWRLQTQTNPPGKGLSTNWIEVPAAAGANSINQPVYPANGSVFYRLIYP